MQAGATGAAVKDGLIPDTQLRDTIVILGGAAQLAGLENGAATSQEPFQGTQHRAYTVTQAAAGEAFSP